MIIQDLITRYSFDIDTGPIDAANDKLDDLVGFAFKIGASVAAASATLFGFSKAAANAGEEATNAAQKFGITAEAYQELMFSARSEADDLKVGLLNLNKAMGAAAGGAKEQKDAFKKLGVAYKDSNGNMKNVDTVLMDVMGSFEKLPDGTKKVALALDIFGKSGANLIPYLNQGVEETKRLREEAVATGYVLSGQALKDSVEYNNSLYDLSNTTKGIVNLIGSGLFPIITKLVKRFKFLIIVNRDLIKSKVDIFFGILMKYIERTVKLGKAMYDVVEGLSRVFGGLANMISLAATALVIFAAGKMLYGLGQMVVLVGNLAKMFTLANAAALAIPIAIGALVVVIALMIEDIYQFFAGGDSVLGVWVEAFKMAIGFISDLFTNFLLSAGDQFKIWGNQFAGWLLGLFQPVLDILKTVGNFLGGGLKNIDFKAMIEPLSQAAKGNFGMSPSNASGSIGQTANNQSNKIDLTQTINVGEGADPLAVGKQVQVGTGNALDFSLRGAQRAFTPGGY